MAELTPPPAIAKLGIATIRDDLPQGMTVDWGRDFALIFRDELMTRFRRPAARCPQPSTRSGSK